MKKIILFLLFFTFFSNFAFAEDYSDILKYSDTKLNSLSENVINSPEVLNLLITNPEKLNKVATKLNSLNLNKYSNLLDFKSLANENILSKIDDLRKTNALELSKAIFNGITLEIDKLGDPIKYQSKNIVMGQTTISLPLDLDSRRLVAKQNTITIVRANQAIITLSSGNYNKGIINGKYNIVQDAKSQVSVTDVITVKGNVIINENQIDAKSQVIIKDNNYLIGKDSSVKSNNILIKANFNDITLLLNDDSLNPKKDTISISSDGLNVKSNAKAEFIIFSKTGDFISGKFDYTKTILSAKSLKDKSILGKYFSEFNLNDYKFDSDGIITKEKKIADFDSKKGLSEFTYNRNEDLKIIQGIYGLSDEQIKSAVIEMGINSPSDEMFKMRQGLLSFFRNRYKEGALSAKQISQLKDPTTILKLANELSRELDTNPDQLSGTYSQNKKVVSKDQKLKGQLEKEGLDKDATISLTSSEKVALETAKKKSSDYDSAGVTSDNQGKVYDANKELWQAIQDVPLELVRYTDTTGDLKTIVALMNHENPSGKFAIGTYVREDDFPNSPWKWVGFYGQADPKTGEIIAIPPPENDRYFPEITGRGPSGDREMIRQGYPSPRSGLDVKHITINPDIIPQNQLSMIQKLPKEMAQKVMMGTVVDIVFQAKVNPDRFDPLNDITAENVYLSDLTKIVKSAKSLTYDSVPDKTNLVDNNFVIPEPEYPVLERKEDGSVVARNIAKLSDSDLKLKKAKIVTDDRGEAEIPSSVAKTPAVGSYLKDLKQNQEKKSDPRLELSTDVKPATSKSSYSIYYLNRPEISLKLDSSMLTPDRIKTISSLKSVGNSLKQLKDPSVNSCLKECYTAFSKLQTQYFSNLASSYASIASGVSIIIRNDNKLEIQVGNNPSKIIPVSNEKVMSEYLRALSDVGLIEKSALSQRNI